jgi:hypothetical protein
MASADTLVLGDHDIEIVAVSTDSGLMEARLPTAGARSAPACWWEPPPLLVSQVLYLPRPNA